MNEKRRKNIREAITLLQAVVEAYDRAYTLIEDAASEEREYYDNMPDNMKEGERGQKADEVAELLEGVRDEMSGFSVDDAISTLENCV